MFPHLPPAEWNRHFLPHYGFGVTPAADFHGVLSADLDGLHKRRGSRRAYIAPRGGAKSTWVTLAYVLRAAVQGWEPHIIILSDSDDQSIQLLSSVKSELEGNGRLAAGYPGATGAGPEWKTDRLRLPNGVLVEAMGKGVRIRGRRNRQSRPSLIVLDDVQSNRDTVSGTERTRAWEWYTREVDPAGDERTNFISVGTALHREAVAVRLLTQPGWVGRTFKAVHSWPERLDLWAEWERIAGNLSDEKRGETAARFFAANRPDMEKGFRGFWPAKWPADRVVEKRAAIGRSAFASEYDGNPATPEGAEWPGEYFDWPGFYFDQWPARLVLRLQTLDPSKGVGARPGDYQGHAWGGIDTNGVIYIDAEGRREANYVQRALDIAAVWKPLELTAEANNTMGLLTPEFERQLRERAEAGRPQLLNYREVIHSDAKLTRIRMAGGYLARRQVRVRNTAGGRMLVEQWRDVPTGEHDDLPDAVATLIRRMEQLAPR